MFGSKARRIEELEREVSYLQTRNAELRDDIHQRIVENKSIRRYLKKIVPIVKHKDFKPAISKDCCECKYRVLDPYNEVIGCRKDNVCADFDPVKEK